MPMLSLSGVFMSLTSFWQNIGININFPEIPVPAPIKKCFTILQTFYNDIIFNVVPQIPKFDYRSKLVILSLGLTLVLDIAIMWFVNPIWQTFLHIGDMVAFGVFGYFLTYGFMERFTVTCIIIVPLSCLWLIIRLLIKCKAFCSKDKSLTSISEDLTHHFLHDIIPGIEKLDNLEEINKKLQDYSGVIEIIPVKPPCWILFFQFLFGCIFIAAGLWFGGIYEIPKIKIPPLVALFGQYVLYILGSFLLILFFLKSFQCTRNFLFKLKKFIKRWGLRLLMLALDLLYIPILTVFVSQITPIKTGCEYGTSFHVNYDGSRWDLLQNHSHVCIPCGFQISKQYEGYNESVRSGSISAFIQENPSIINYTLGYITSPYNYNYQTMTSAQKNTCADLCAGHKTLFLEADQSLYWFKEVIQVNGGSILFAVIFIMFGIPFLYSHLILHNSSIIKDMKVFGNDEKEKWQNSVARLHTTGIFLFAEFISINVFWSVGVLAYKFTVMAMSTLTSSVNKYIFTSMPVIYLIMFIIVVKRRPHMNKFNNILDALLYFLNFLFSFVPILALNKIIIPSKYLVPVSFAILVIPFISIAYFIIASMCRKPSEDDPTVIRNFSEEELEEREQRIKAQKRARNSRRGRGKKGKKGKKVKEDPFVISETTQPVPQQPQYIQPGYPQGDQYPQYFQQNYYPPNMAAQQTQQPQLQIQPMIQLADLQDIDELDFLPEDYTTITMEQIESINKARHLTKEENKTFKVNKIILAQRMTEMYDIFDLIIDGATIGKLANFLTSAVLFASGALGWFIAAIMIRYEHRETAICTQFL